MDGLLDFAVNGVFPHDGVVFFQLHTVRGVFAVFLRNVARGAGETAVFVLRALKDNLNAVAFTFLCHCVFIFRLARGEV